MSYILDALKKSEEARKRGTVPDVLSVQTVVPPAPAGISRRAYLIAGTLILAAGFGVWIGLLRAGVQVPAVRQQGAQIQSPSAVGRNNPPEGDASETVRNRGGDTDVSPGSREGKAEQSPSQVVLPHQTPAGQMKRTSSAHTADRHVGSGSEIADKDAVKTHGEALPPAEKRLYRLAELPAVVRKTLPDFSIAAFLFSEDPSLRMVRINGRMLREGEDLSPGLRLEEITRDGVIMRLQDYRFSVPVRQ